MADDLWRSNNGRQNIRPYHRDLHLLAKHKDEFECFRNANVVAGDKLSFVHIPIRDSSVTDDDTVLRVCQYLAHDVANGEVLYIHCWGGHGRTGTIVSILLHMMYGVSDLYITLTYIRPNVNVCVVLYAVERR